MEKVGAVLAMRMAQYEDIQFDAASAKKLQEEFWNIELGSSTGLVMICTKPKCLYKSRCALYRIDQCPTGRECVHENKILTDAIGKYITSLGVDLDNYSEMVLINQLVEYELIEHRCNAILSNLHTDMRMRSVIGVDKDGNIIEKEEISHALSIKEKFQAKKIQLLESFTATRKEQYKKQAALKEAKDGPIKQISSMKKKLQNARAKSVSADDVHDELNALQDFEILEDGI
jgi:hypothetical protein